MCSWRDNQQQTSTGWKGWAQCHFLLLKDTKQIGKVCETFIAWIRKAIQAAWLTWDNQNKHYTSWEWWLVYLGFGWWPTNDVEGTKHGNVVFHKGQKQQIIQFDKMGFHLMDPRMAKEEDQQQYLSMKPFLTQGNQQTSQAIKFHVYLVWILQMKHSLQCL